MKIADFIAKKSIFLIIILVFILGWLTNSLVLSVGAQDELAFLGIYNGKEVDSPSDHIKKDQINVFEDKIILDIPNARWAEFTDTNSMDPVLDVESNSIEIIPESIDDINVGDIIDYKPKNFNGLVVHRVIEINTDADGWFCKVKGDNLANPDPGEIRFNQIEGILVGIIY